MTAAVSAVPAHLRPIAVVGPTGTGKSALALELAAEFGGEIVNIDAMQQYRGMDIGTAKVPVADRRGIAHHQLDVLPVTATATVGRYQRAATADIEHLLAAGKRPVIVGGSMMYVQALLDDWQLPPTDPQVRGRLEDDLASCGVAALHERLRALDPAAAAIILPTDGRRTVRALEVIELTGKPFAAAQPSRGVPRWNAIVVGLDDEVATLDERLAARTAAMFAAGLLGEVESLLAVGLRDGVTASRAIGYTQALQVLDGTMTAAEAEEATFIGTRRYVRRQRSWFRRDQRIRWYDAADPALSATVLAALQSTPHR